MHNDSLADLTVSDIMQRWPTTIGVFIDWQLHCVGCPIGGFHTLSDAAAEHGLALEALTAAVAGATTGPATAVPARGRRRLASGDGRP